METQSKGLRLSIILGGNWPISRGILAECVISIRLLEGGADRRYVWLIYWAKKLIFSLFVLIEFTVLQIFFRFSYSYKYETFWKWESFEDEMSTKRIFFKILESSFITVMCKVRFDYIDWLEKWRIRKKNCELHERNMSNEYNICF